MAVETQTQIPAFFADIPPNTLWGRGSAPAARHRAIASGIHAFGRDMLERMEKPSEPDYLRTSEEVLRTNGMRLLEVIKGSEPSYAIPRAEFLSYNFVNPTMEFPETSKFGETVSISYERHGGARIVTFEKVGRFSTIPIIKYDNVSETLQSVMQWGVTLIPQVATILQVTTAPNSWQFDRDRMRDIQSHVQSTLNTVKQSFKDMEASFVHIADMAQAFNGQGLLLAITYSYKKPA